MYWSESTLRILLIAIVVICLGLFVWIFTSSYRKKRKILRKIGNTNDCVRVLTVLGFKRMGNKSLEGFEPRSFLGVPSDPQREIFAFGAHDEKGFLWINVLKEETRDSEVSMIEDILLNHCHFKREEKKPATNAV